MPTFLNSLVKSFSQMVVSGSPILNEALAQLLMKRGSSLLTSAFYMVTRDKDSDRLATLDRGIAHGSPPVSSFDGARTPV